VLHLCLVYCIGSKGHFTVSSLSDTTHQLLEFGLGRLGLVGGPKRITANQFTKTLIPTKKNINQ